MRWSGNRGGLTGEQTVDFDPHHPLACVGHHLSSLLSSRISRKKAYKNDQKEAGSIEVSLFCWGKGGTNVGGGASVSMIIPRWAIGRVNCCLAKDDFLTQIFFSFNLGGERTTQMEDLSQTNQPCKQQFSSLKLFAKTFPFTLDEHHKI